MSDVMVLRRRESEFPRTLLAFSEEFCDESICVDVLRRWKYGKSGFRCPRCSATTSWFIESRRLDQCTNCRKQVSLTSGTVLHGTRKPVRMWFLAMYLFVMSKQGISALELKRELGLNYETAWSWLHKLRSAVGRRTLDLLRGIVEADETWEGGITEKRCGRPRAGGKKALVAGAVERMPSGRLGRARLQKIRDGSSASLGAFLQEHVAAGSTLLTDDWRSYRKPAKAMGCDHRATNVSKSGKQGHEVLPSIHLLFSLLHRVLITTHQGAISHKHLPAYLAEFVFRFNRRTSASRGLLFQRLLSVAVVGAPPVHWQIVGRIDPKTPLKTAA